LHEILCPSSPAWALRLNTIDLLIQILSAFCKDELLNCGCTFVVAVAAFEFLRGFLLELTLVMPVTLGLPLVDTAVVTCVDFPPDCNVLPDGRLFLLCFEPLGEGKVTFVDFDDRATIPVGVGILDGKPVVTADVGVDGIFKRASD